MTPPAEIVAATGEVGDVYLIHPLLLHSASVSCSPLPRAIFNLPIPYGHVHVGQKQGPLCAVSLPLRAAADSAAWSSPCPGEQSRADTVPRLPVGSTAPHRKPGTSMGSSVMSQELEEPQEPPSPGWVEAVAGGAYDRHDLEANTGKGVEEAETNGSCCRHACSSSINRH